MECQMNPHEKFLMVAATTCAMLLNCGSASAQATHFAVLSGGKVVSAGGDAAAGDPDGLGSASLVIDDSGRVCVDVLVSKLDTPTAAEIRMGWAGKTGAVL